MLLDLPSNDNKHQRRLFQTVSLKPRRLDSLKPRLESLKGRRLNLVLDQNPSELQLKAQLLLRRVEKQAYLLIWKSLLHQTQFSGLNHPRTSMTKRAWIQGKLLIWQTLHP